MGASDGFLQFVLRLLNGLNNFLHHPFIFDISWYLYWGVCLLLAPLCLPVLLVLFIYDVLSGTVFLERLIEPMGRAVLITGCDSGFGKDLAVALAAKNWKVYAGCLTTAGVEALKDVAPGLLTPIQLDVTKGEQIEAAMKLIAKENPKGLYGLVNNAGVGHGGIADWMPMEHFRLLMEVNFFATVNCCKAALPLLKLSARHGQGARIVNVTSFAGVFPGLIVLSAYAASKHAAQAFSQTLRMEVEPFGVHVCTVSPTFHATAMADSKKQLIAAYESMPAEKQAEYGPEYLKEILRTTEQTQMLAWEVANVRRILLHAVAGVRSRGEYVVGTDARFVMGFLRALPGRIQRVLMSVGGRFYRLRPVGGIHQQSATIGG